MGVVYDRWPEARSIGFGPQKGLSRLGSRWHSAFQFSSLCAAPTFEVLARFAPMAPLGPRKPAPQPKSDGA